ncbi:hypothetical protein P775_07305 [Puniceibacterium antarcticum]|uniref:Bile acid:sodium symporter n=1 Tax=Puniceibacterium antarcticum TaxID=1206336 RepID=A0A2G8RHK2_9RHOB|nr:hypothetical protein [Puniceibacterium antarcticum]PIL20881.1 hypothetical protein P775_07305 [Puniceibacterium antarcticum]
MAPLHILARHARLCLVLGLLAGLALPDVARAMRPWLPELVALLLFLTALRVGPRAALGGLALGRRSLSVVLVLQVALPLTALLLFALFGVLDTPFGLAVLLMLAAPSVTGAPNFAIMAGQDPAPAMRVLVLGTLLFPLTVLPLLLMLPQLGGTGAALRAVVWLIAITMLAVAGGFACRTILLPRPSDAQIRALDGISALALAVIVVGLMSAIGPLLRSDPTRLTLWLLAVMAVNFGLQLASFALMRRRWSGEGWAVPVSIIAGNRNIALFLVALPAGVTDPLLLFIGCYQIPMYLTPILLRRLYDR